MFFVFLIINQHSYFDITFNGKHPPNLATTQSKCGEFLTNVASNVDIHSSVSIEFNFPKHAAANPNRQRIAFDPSHSVHDEPMSIARPLLYLFDNVPRLRKLHDEISGAHAGGPLVTNFSNDS